MKLKKLISGISAFALALTTFGISAMADGNVCKIGDNEYETWSDAYSAAEDGNTITLLQDCEVGGYIKIEHSITVDLDTHNLTCTKTADNSTTSCIVIGGSKNIKFINGTVKPTGISGNRIGSIFDVSYAGNLTLSNIKTDVTNIENLGSAVAINGGKALVTIKDSSEISKAGYGSAIQYCCYGNSSVNIGSDASGDNTIINGNILCRFLSDKESEGQINLYSGKINGDITAKSEKKETETYTQKCALTVTDAKNIAKKIILQKPSTNNKWDDSTKFTLPQKYAIEGNNIGLKFELTGSDKLSYTYTLTDTDTTDTTGSVTYIQKSEEDKYDMLQVLYPNLTGTTKTLTITKDGDAKTVDLTNRLATIDGAKSIISVILVDIPTGANVSATVSSN